MKKLCINFLILWSLFQIRLFAQPPCGGTPNQIRPAESCPEACVYCDFNGYMGTTGGYAPNGIPPGGFCSMIQNDQWLGFIAGATSATFTVTPSNCVNGNGVQVALYESCNTAPLACNAGGAGNGNTPTIITVSLIPGTNYFLLIDGLSGDDCDLTVTVSPPSAVKAPDVGIMLPIESPLSKVCPGGTITMSVPAVPNAGTYTWSGPAGTLINGEPAPVTIDAPDGRIVQVTFPLTAGTAQICVNANNSCDDGPTQCKNIAIQPLSKTVFPPQTVCYEDFPYTLPWGDVTDKIGTWKYSASLTSFAGCDSIVEQTVTVKPQLNNNLGVRYICKSGFLDICGNKIIRPGEFTVSCSSFQGCDSTVTGRLAYLNPTAKIIQTGSIACAGKNGVLTLQSVPSTSGTLKTWHRDGTLVGFGNSINVSKPGLYVLTSSIKQGNFVCTVSDTFEVKQGLAGPAPVITIPVWDVINCKNPSLTLQAIATQMANTFIWNGASLNDYSGASVTITQPGTYHLFVSNENGCTATQTLTIAGSLAKPTISINKQTQGTTVRLNCTTTAQNPGFQWSGPGGFVSNLPNPIVVQFGTYTVTVTDGANFCTNTKSFNYNQLQSAEERNGVSERNLNPVWHIYPNPAQEWLFVERTGQSTPSSVEMRVFDLRGKMVMQQKSNTVINTLPISNLASGIYILEMIESGDKAAPQRMKFTVER
jgi:Secretion system C-terminal sorting domain/PKD-like domain